jgi:GNAT superfamily N-acetyltransferase
MSLVVRAARLSDRDFIVDGNVQMAIETEGRAPDPALVTAGVEAALLDPSKGRFYVAELDGRPAGQLLVQREWSDWRNGWFWWIASVHVVADLRGRGLYRALYQHVRHLAEADPSVCGLRLYVEDHNEGARAVYSRLGMRDGHYRVYEEDFRPPSAVESP